MCLITDGTVRCALQKGNRVQYYVKRDLQHTHIASGERQQFGLSGL